MAEKKATKKAAAEKKTAAEAAAPKRTYTRRAAKEVIVYNAETVGFKAGDVYQTLSAAEKPLSVKEIAKAANISETYVHLGMGWLLKEGQIKEEEGLITLA